MYVKKQMTSVEMMSPSSKEATVAWAPESGCGADVGDEDPMVMVTFWPCSQWSPTVQMK